MVCYSSHSNRAPLSVADGLEEGASVKKARASSVDEVHSEPDQSLDERGGDNNNDNNNNDDDGSEEQRARVPPGFLSPSVQEYLELGKSIPGEWGRGGAVGE